MKGQSKRFVNHIGKLHDIQIKKKKNTEEDIGFLDLWRYATVWERAVTALGVALSWGGSAGLISAVVVYGELTALFVSRHKAEATPSQAVLLGLFNGGRVLPAGNRSLHMDALVEDSIAFGLASVAIMAFQLVTSSSAVILANWAANKMITRLRWRLLRAVISQEIAFFDTNTTMNFASTLTEDMEKLRAGVGEHVVMTSHLVGSVVMGASLSLTYGWELTLVGLAVIPVALIVAAIVSKYQTKCSAKEVEAYSTASRIVEEALTNIKTVRAFAGEELEVQLYRGALAPGARWAGRRALWAGLGAGAGWALTYALNAAVLARGAALCVRDMPLPPDQRPYHVGVMVTVLFCTFMAAQNLSMCQPHVEVISAARGAARALFALLERRARIPARGGGGGGARPASFRGDIEFNDLYFNYPSRPDVKVLRGLNLSVKAGETIALVGGSGCGKSTLLQLLQRLYEPDSGSITVDGYPLADLDLHHYRTRIGVVGQEPVLFSGTIRENITLGLDDVTEEQLVAAAELAHAHQFITKLADGYDTMLGAGGAALSGGQKQRIAIARAAARRPGLLLLDEPTSALDAAAERAVQAALDAAAKRTTTIIVSHRLSTIVNANRIVYMEHGAVLEQGTHRELLEMKGLYWKLVQEDMTNRSIADNVLAGRTEGDADDDDVTAGASLEPLARSFSRRSTCRSSLVRDGALRGRTGLAPLADLSTPFTEYEEDPAEQPEGAAPPVSAWALLRLSAAEWPLLAGGGVASFFVGATMPVFALLFSKLYGMFASSSPALIERQAAQYAALFGAAAALCGALTFLQSWLFSRAGARLTDRLRELTFRNFLNQEQGWFDSPHNSVGALCARLATDAAAVQGATGTRLGAVMQGVSTTALGVGLALAYSWKMTLVSLLSVPCVIGGIYLEGYVTRRSEERERKALEQASRVATEAVLNVRTVHSLGVEWTMLARYRGALAPRRARGPALVRGAVYGLCLCAPTLGYAVSLAYGGYLIAREDLQYEYAILVSEALIYGAWMLAEALSFAPSFAAAKRSGARILQALQRKPLIAADENTKDDPDWQPSGEVDFSSVHFSYPTRPNVPVLRGLQLHLQPRRTVALVGASGCGKSTVMHLLLRNYDPDRGTVSVDGHSTRTLHPSRLRAALGLVQQEPALFARTLRDNIAYGDTGRRASMQEVVEAATKANVHAFITSLPMGYDTHLGAGGAALSGGQKQRVAIARALLRDPRLLLLDEATSALDAASEKAVQAALEAASEDRTTIIIAHRLATVQRAHTICVIDKGVVAESGSHSELVRRRGLYWRLLQQQAPAN